MNRDLALTDDGGSWPLDRYAPGAPQAEAEESSGPALDLVGLVRIIREWRWVILGALAFGIAAAIIYTFLSTPMFRSSVSLEVNPPTVEVTEEQGRQRAAAPATYDLVATQAQLLRSQSVAQRTAEDLNLANREGFVDQSLNPSTRLRQAASKVKRDLFVDAPEVGTLIKFDYVSEDPQLAAQIANGVADAFINLTLQRRYEASSYARNFLERQIAKTRTDLERSERQLVAYAQAQGIINTGSNQEGGTAGDAASPTGESLLALNRALAEATARRVAAEGAYRASRSSGQTSEVTSSTQELRNQRALLQSQYQEKREMMKDEHPEMLSLRSRIAELDRAIAREGSTVAAGQSNSLLAEYRGALAAENALQARVNQLKGAVLNLRGRSIQYTILQRDVDTNRALYEALLQRYKEIGVAGGIGSSPVSIVDRGQVPGSPFKPKLLTNLFFGVVAGLLAGLAAAVALAYLNDTIDTRDDVRKKLGLACLGAIPKRPAKDTFVEDLRDPTSLVSEAYSTVVTSLGFSTERGMPNAILVTSARPSEGKSSSALALAQNCSRRGNKVLLIDCDLRKPAFKSPSAEEGLTTLLTNDGSISQHIAPTLYPDLWLLGAGPIPPNPADLLATGRFPAILREATAQFDVVIIDAPPTLGLSDAPLLAAVIKNIMFVIESGKTRTTAAKEAIRLLRVPEAHILGATLTKATEEAGVYGYSYGYGYGYGKKYGALAKRAQIALVADESEV